MQLLEQPVVKELNFWLSCFIVEVRRSDKKPYPASSISNILAGLYRYPRECSGDCRNFVDRKNMFSRS